MEKALKAFIDNKANGFNPQDNVDIYVSRIIKGLNAYLEGEHELDDDEIQKCLNALIGYFTTSLCINIDAKQKILRARTYDTDHRESYTHALSYIPIEKAHLSKLGRLNREGSRIYYGCLYFDESLGGIDVSFSEAQADEGMTVNILRSSTISELKVIYLGLFDLVHRQQKPWFISDPAFDTYHEVYEYQRKKYSKEIFVSHLLCDAFFSDIFRRQGSERLYKITSELAKIIFDDTSADGLIYGSVEAEGSPLIALRTTSVDTKMLHVSAEAYEIQKKYGYGLFRAKHVYDGNISGNQITWSKM